MLKRLVSRIVRQAELFLRDERGAWFLLLLVGLALNIIAYLILPKPKQPKPEAAKDLENPVADPSKELNVVFGTITVKGLNVLDFKDKSKRTYQVDA